MEDKDMQYDFSKQKFPKRGLVYIIVNETFPAHGYPDRPGAYTDYKNMKKLFKPLNLKLMTYYDKTGKQIKDILRNASKRPDLAERSCFMCIISSHGLQMTEVNEKEKTKTMEHAVVGVDGNTVATKDLVEYFSEDNCHAMAGKPKLFFIQACRETIYNTDHSKAVDIGVTVQYIVSAKLSKHRRMRQRLSLNPKYDSADSKPYQTSVPKDALSHIIDPTSKNESDNDDDDQFSDGYDTATTDEESDADSDRETGHEELKTRDRSVYTDLEQNEEVQHIQAITPTDQNKDIVPKDEEKTEIQPNKAIPSSDDQSDAGRRKAKRRFDTYIPEAEIMEVIAIPCHDDMLVMFASPPGKLAWRSTSEGGWLLANLYNVFKQYIRSRKIRERDFLSILIEVSQDVSLKETDTDDPKFNGMKMVPTIYHRLTKEVVMCVDKETGLLKKLKEKISEFIPK